MLVWGSAPGLFCTDKAIELWAALYLPAWFPSASSPVTWPQEKYLYWKRFYPRNEWSRDEVCQFWIQTELTCNWPLLFLNWPQVTCLISRSLGFLSCKNANDNDTYIAGTLLWVIKEDALLKHLLGALRRFIVAIDITTWSFLNILVFFMLHPGSQDITLEIAQQWFQAAFFIHRLRKR